jgi:5-(carboxyamino)imidazole ribonucleotide mutase
VIGVPLAAGALGGFDALLATVQMPPGIPVATVGVDASRNAGFLAARILSLRHPEVAVRLDAQMAEDRKRYTAPPAARMTPPKEAVVAAAEGEREEKKAKGGKKKKRKRKA